MTDAPERIWAWPFEDWYRGGCSTAKVVAAGAKDVEYIRADLAAPTVKPEDILDAASEYLVRVYGIGALSHPVDRSLILSALENNT